MLQRSVVGEHDVPPAVEHDAGIRVVRAQQSLERRPHVLRGRVVDRGLVVTRGVAGGEQQRVALAQRHVEVTGEGEQQLGARARAPGLDEAQMLGRHAGFEREIHLAAPAPAPPLAE